MKLIRLKLLLQPHSRTNDLSRRCSSILSSRFTTSTHAVKYIKPPQEITRSFFMFCGMKQLENAVNLLETKVTLPPHIFIYTKILQLCIEKRGLQEGKRVVAHMEKYGFTRGKLISNKIIELYCKCGHMGGAQKVFDEMCERDLCSWNTLISGYTKVGMVEEARKLFDQMPQRDNFSWTAMISGYAKYKCPEEALELYRVMQRSEGFVCDNKFTVSSALSASAALHSLNLAKEIHARIMRTGMESDVVVWGALLDVYGKCGSVNEAWHVFNRTVEKDIVSWTTMIDRYFGDGRFEEGFSLFSDMVRSRIRPNDYTFAALLTACTHQTAEHLGQQVHGHMIRIEYSPYSYAASALVHMYCKCGSVETARRVLRGLRRPDLVSWTSLINGYAQNGQPVQALRLFENLLRSGTRPDHVTFVGVLSACTHAGLVDMGLEYFNSIEEKHGLKLTVDHYACVVDLLSRAGRFKEAEDIISKMPMKPDKFLWASLLGGCRIHRNYELAERAAQALFELEPDNAATYVTLANIYAAAGNWSEVARLRKMIDDIGVVKKPGLSWITVNKKMHKFLVGDQSHPRSQEIFDFLAEVSNKMKQQGFVPHTHYVLHDVEEEQKEESLFYHSEKLAVAFGIISTPPGTPVKVFKNLRTCVDCHAAIKFISSIAERKIIIRDSSRFHHFDSGACSCNDYW